MRRKRSRFFGEAQRDKSLVYTLLPAYKFIHLTLYAYP
jgi:hypothetical protein